MRLCLIRAELPPSSASCSNSKGWFYTDMISTQEGVLIQNKTHVGSTDLDSSVIVTSDLGKPGYDFIIFYKNRPDDTHGKMNLRPMCQANPFGIEW